MKVKLFFIGLILLPTSSFSQIADYYTAGYHVQKYDTFLESFSKYTEPCFKSSTFKMSVTSTKMRLEIEDSFHDSGNTSGDSYIKDILIGKDLPPDSGAKMHKSITGTMKKLVVNNGVQQSVIPKYDVVKFKGRVYAHNFDFNDLLNDAVETLDIYFCFEYENGQKENMYFHLSQKSPQQIESENFNKKMQNDMAEVQNQKNKQIQEQRRVREEQERLRKEQKAAKNLQDVNSLMNQLIDITNKK